MGMFTLSDCRAWTTSRPLEDIPLRGAPRQYNQPLYDLHHLVLEAVILLRLWIGKKQPHTVCVKPRFGLTFRVVADSRPFAAHRGCRKPQERLAGCVGIAGIKHIPVDIVDVDPVEE